MDFCSLVPAESSRLLFRTVQESDLPDLLEINSNAEVTGFLPYPTWVSIEDGRAWLGRMQKLADTKTGQQFVLALKDSGKVVGTLLLFRHEPGSRRAEIGYVLGRNYWKQGLMLEALKALCGHCFAESKLRRLEAEVQPSNDASQKLLQRLGFVNEGLLRQRWVAKGRPYDTNLYGLLADEWRS